MMRDYKEGEVKQTDPEVNQVQRPNFVGKDGQLFLVRCFVCGGETGRENWGPAVATGKCHWCGWGEQEEKV